MMWLLVAHACRLRFVLLRSPINSWNRQPYLTLDANGIPTVNITENSIHHNMILAGYGGTFPLDHDDGSSNYHDHHNVLLYGPAKNWQGHSKRFVDNLQVYV
jgi:hypothetical protein